FFPQFSQVLFSLFVCCFCTADTSFVKLDRLEMLDYLKLTSLDTAQLAMLITLIILVCFLALFIWFLLFDCSALADTEMVKQAAEKKRFERSPAFHALFLGFGMHSRVGKDSALQLLRTDPLASKKVLLHVL